MKCTKEKDFYYKTLFDFVISYSAEITRFQYSKKLFQRELVEVTIKFHHSSYELLANEDGIYLNKELVCNHSYEYLEKESTIEKLMSILKDKIFQEN